MIVRRTQMPSHESRSGHMLQEAVQQQTSELTTATSSFPPCPCDEAVLLGTTIAMLAVQQHATGQ